MTTDDISNGRWTFYDSWAAFPLNRVHNTERNVVGEFNIGLDAPDGGTYGEFSIKFHQFDRDIAARLDAFGDSWKVLAAGGLIDALATLDGQPQGPDEVRALLLGLGYEDRTAALRGDHPTTCPTCHGKGVLDAVTPGEATR